MWAPQLAALKSRFRLIAPDLRGFGTTPVSGPWSLQEAADNLAELLDSLRIAECGLIGLSMGGYIALPFYAKHPQRVRQLVLANTRARADNETEKAARTKMIADLEQSGATILSERMLPRLLKPNAPPEIVQGVRAIIDTTGVTAAIHALMAMRDRPDASTVLHHITCPTLVIAGEYDVVTRVQECREMASTIADARFKTIMNAGHLSNLEDSEAFNQALAGFLTDV
jgi:pimeloyl-ACP methyl ester carboxylesterase